MRTFVTLPKFDISDEEAVLVKEALHAKSNGLTHSCSLCRTRTRADRRRMHKGIILPVIGWYHKVGMEISTPRKVSPFKIDLGFTQAKQWSLVEQIGPAEIADWPESSPRPSKGWRITEEFGEPFLLGQIRIRTVAIVYKDRPIAHEGRPKYIYDVLRGFGFDWEELMSGGQQLSERQLMYLSGQDST
jgi:hypothetical protein